MPPDPDKDSYAGSVSSSSHRPPTPLQSSCLPSQALPAVEYPKDVSQWQPRVMLPDVLLWTLVALYVGLTVRDIWLSVKMDRKVRTVAWPRCNVAGQTGWCGPL